MVLNFFIIFCSSNLLMLTTICCEIVIINSYVCSLHSILHYVCTRYKNIYNILPVKVDSKERILCFHWISWTWVKFRNYDYIPTLNKLQNSFFALRRRETTAKVRSLDCSISKLCIKVVHLRRQAMTPKSRQQGKLCSVLIPTSEAIRLNSPWVSIHLVTNFTNGIQFPTFSTHCTWKDANFYSIDTEKMPKGVVYESIVNRQMGRINWQILLRTI